jgi:hypothetical protein
MQVGPHPKRQRRPFHVAIPRSTVPVTSPALRTLPISPKYPCVTGPYPSAVPTTYPVITLEAEGSMN